jgi:hypothetical protein
MFNRKNPKDKNAKSSSRLSFLSRKKDRASGTIDNQQAQDNGGTSESSTLISKIEDFDMPPY